MRVLHVIASVDPRGGSPIEGVMSSARIWGANNAACDVLSLEAPEPSWLAGSSVTVLSVGFAGAWYRLLRKHLPWLRYAYVPGLRLWLNRNATRYDAVVINGLWNYASFGTWRALRRLDLPYFVFTHGMLDPWFTRAYPIKSFFKAAFWKLVEHKVVRDARGVFFTCEEERQRARQSFSPYIASEFVVGYGARDVDGDPETHRRAFAAKLPQLKQRRFVLFLGRIHPKKGVDVLIRAFARTATRFPDVDLVIAGPDQAGWTKDLQQLAADTGIANRVHWPGMLSGDAKWGAFRSADFFALASHQENFGLVIAEAMALGQPVLITNKVNIWREIEADNAGLVVNDDVDSVADGLEWLCALTPVQRGDIGRNGRACFFKRYRLETNALQQLSLMQRLSAGLEPSDRAGRRCRQTTVAPSASKATQPRCLVQAAPVSTLMRLRRISTRSTGE
jgi:glycosyltransferase involved in cell wall biosynthesis